MRKIYTLLSLSFLLTFAVGKTGFSQMTLKLGKDTTYCVGSDTIYLGQNMILDGGVEPYTMAWECNEERGNSFYTASDFLNDTTIASPYIPYAPVKNEWVKFTLHVTDSENNYVKDSISVRFSQFAYLTGYSVFEVQKGDSVLFNQSSVGGGIEPLSFHWQPTLGLTNPDNLVTWCKTDSLTQWRNEYDIVATDSCGCVSNPNLVYEVRESSVGSFVVPGKQWVYLLLSYHAGTVRNRICYKLGSDTTIAESNYYKLLEFYGCKDTYTIKGYLRETNDQLVYFRPPDSDREFLLYDFGMSVGDSTYMEWFDGYYRLDSTGINDDSRKIYYMADSQGNLDTWVEGTGSLDGLLKESFVGEDRVFTCCILDEELLYKNPHYENCYFSSNAQLKVNAGNDLIICSGGNAEYILGGYPAAWGGVEPYTYTWSGKHFDLKFPAGIPSWIYASDILDDTTKSNPVITEWRNVPEQWTTYYLKVEDAEGTIMYDSVLVIRSVFIIGGPYKLPVTIHKGDSVQLFGNISIFSNFEPLTEFLFSPSHGLSDPTDIYGWAKPDTSITYYLQAVNSVGCVSPKIYYWHIEVIDTISASNNIISNPATRCFLEHGSLTILRPANNHSIYNLIVTTLTGQIIHTGTYREQNLRLPNLGLKPKTLYIVSVNDDVERRTFKLLNNYTKSR